MVSASANAYRTHRQAGKRHDDLPILLSALPALALSIASLRVCTRDAERARLHGGIQREHPVDERRARDQRVYGVFNTIKAAPPAEPVASPRIALADTSGASAVQRTTAQAHRPAPVAVDSRMS